MTLEFDRLLTLEENTTLMGLAGELGAPYPGGFKLETHDDNRTASKRLFRCSNCGQPVGLKTSPESWFFDVIENVRPGLPIRLCGECNGSVTEATREQMTHEMNRVGSGLELKE